jgi:hypothetical protein
MLAALVRISFGLLIGAAACIALLVATCADLLEGRSRRHVLAHPSADSAAVVQDRSVPTSAEVRT